MEYEGEIKAKWDDTIKNHYVYLHYTLDMAYCLLVNYDYTNL